MLNFILFVLVIFFVFYLVQANEILKKIEKFAEEHQSNNNIAKLILVFIQYSSLQILNSVIIFLFLILIISVSMISFLESISNKIS